MRILRDETTSEPCVLALGTFDGVHRGHQALLRRGRMMSEAQGSALCVCTFSVHPREVFDPENAPKHLTTLPERASLMVGAGVDMMRILPFDRRVAAMPPEDFLTMLAERFCPSGIVCGDDYTFGCFGSGNTALLKAWAEKKGLPVEAVSEVRVNGQRVSSSLIREKLVEGDISRAEELLGHSYTLSGKVKRVRREDGASGLSIVDMAIQSGKQLPAFGVYTCLAEWTGMRAPALARIGSRSSQPFGKVIVSARALTGERGLTGGHLRLTFCKLLRPEKTLMEGP